MKTVRLYYLLLSLGCAGLLGFGYYLQFFVGLAPCPLCIFQRVAYFAILFISLAGCIHGPDKLGIRIYSGLILLTSLIGAGIAARQVYLQHLPADQVPECGPGLDYMLDAFPLTETLKMVFTGSGECAEVHWSFLTLSIAEWSLVCFSVLSLLSVLHIVRGNKLYDFSFFRTV